MPPVPPSAARCHGVSRFHLVLPRMPGAAQCCLMLPSAAQCHLVLRGTTQYYPVPPSATRCHLVLPSATGAADATGETGATGATGVTQCHPVLPGTTRCHPGPAGAMNSTILVSPLVLSPVPPGAAARATTSTITHASGARASVVTSTTACAAAGSTGSATVGAATGATASATASAATGAAASAPTSAPTVAPLVPPVASAVAPAVSPAGGPTGAATRAAAGAATGLSHGSRDPRTGPTSNFKNNEEPGCVQLHMSTVQTNPCLLGTDQLTGTVLGQQLVSPLAARARPLVTHTSPHQHQHSTSIDPPERSIQVSRASGSGIIMASSGKTEKVECPPAVEYPPEKKKGGFFKGLSDGLNKVGKGIEKGASSAADSLNKTMDENWKSDLLDNFRTNMKVQLISCKSGKALQFYNGELNGLGADLVAGGEDPQIKPCTWVVLNDGNNIVRLHVDNNYIGIVDGATVTKHYSDPAQTGQETRMRLQQTGKYIMFESVCEPKCHVGVMADGCLKCAKDTGKEEEAQFGVRLIYSPYPPAVKK